MMTREEITVDLLKELARRHKIDVSEIRMDSHLISDLGADSLDIVELIMYIEETFGVHIPDEDAVQITTPAAILDYIEREVMSGSR